MWGDSNAEKVNAARLRWYKLRDDERLCRLSILDELGSFYTSNFRRANAVQTIDI